VGKSPGGAGSVEVGGDVVVRVVGGEASGETVVEGTAMPGLDVLMVTSCARENGRNGVRYRHVAKGHVTEVKLVKPCRLPASLIFTVWFAVSCLTGDRREYFRKGRSGR
jgi:hypothetical protein